MWEVAIMSNFKGILARAGAAGAAAALLMAPAIAEPARADMVQRVHYADLDLESEAGRATLDRRMMRAARSVCAPATPVRSLFVDLEVDRCVADSRADHQARIGDAIREARHQRLGNAQTGNATPR
jgi:UrcA family protein